MFKFFGAVFIFSACCTIGFSRAFKMKKRVSCLEKMLSAIRFITAEITFSKKRIERIFNEAAQQTGLSLFAYAAENISEVGFSKAWKKALADSRNDMELTDEDTECLLTLSQITAYSGEAQRKALSASERLCELSLEQARDELAKSSKLFTSGSVLVGMLAIILLL